MNADPSAPQEALASRIRECLTGRAGLREVRMFGGLSFMVDGAIAVAARHDGSLLVRTDPARYEELISAGGMPAVMGADRRMGTGWIVVDERHVSEDEDLARWIEIGVSARG